MIAFSLAIPFLLSNNGHYLVVLALVLCQACTGFKFNLQPIESKIFPIHVYINISHFSQISIGHFYWDITYPLDLWHVAISLWNFISVGDILHLGETLSIGCHMLGCIKRFTYRTSFGSLMAIIGEKNNFLLSSLCSFVTWAGFFFFAVLKKALFFCVLVCSMAWIITVITIAFFFFCLVDFELRPSLPWGLGLIISFCLPSYFPLDTKAWLLEVFPIATKFSIHCASFKSKTQRFSNGESVSWIERPPTYDWYNVGKPFDINWTRVVSKMRLIIAAMLFFCPLTEVMYSFMLSQLCMKSVCNWPLKNKDIWAFFISYIDIRIVQDFAVMWESGGAKMYFN